MNQKLTVQIMGFPVNADYQYYWLTDSSKAENIIPHISHIDFYSDKDIISSSGYRSYFFQIEKLFQENDFNSVQELVTSIAEAIAKENELVFGSVKTQLTLF